MKEVIPSTKDGNKVRAVIRARTCKERLYEVEPSPYSVEVNAGRPPVRPAKLSAAIAADNLAGLTGGLPALTSTEYGDGSTSYSLSLQVLALMTALTLLPSLVLGMTSFTRIIIVLSILRQAMGTQQTPPNQVLIAIALFLSLFIMAPTFTTVYEDAADPYLNGDISADIALTLSLIHI